MESNLNQDNKGLDLQLLPITTEEAVTNDSKASADSSVNASAQEQLQMDTPAEGDCLFWAVMLGMLVRFKDSDNFQTVVSRLFGKEDAKANADDLRDRLLPMYQGRVSDIQSFDTSHAFYRLMMLFRVRVANHIAEAKELHDSIEGVLKAYCGQMSRQGTWGGEIEIKAMASLLKTDIVVRRQGQPERRVPANAERETTDALHIAHVSTSAESSVNNHYHFLVPKSNAYWPRTNDNHEEKKTSDEGLSSRNQTVQSNNNAAPSPIEQAARDAFAKYQNWLFLSYPAMNLLGRLLHSRLPNQPSDPSFENKILSILVTGNIDHPAESKSTPAQSVMGMFMNKYNRGNQGFFGSSTGRDAKFPGSLRALLGGLATQVDRRIAPPLRRMDPNLMDVMGSFLTLQDRVALVQTCKSLSKDVGRKVSVNRLLSLVAQGRQDEAEKLIKKDPSLLLERGDVTDGAGRTFRDITALQYAVWALDAHMWTMILPYFDRISARGSAGDQLRQLEQKGTAHGKHFNFKPLLDAYAAYNRRPSEATWCREVGREQRLLADHVIQEYMMPGRPFDPMPSFAVAGARRPTVTAERGVRWWREDQSRWGGTMLLFGQCGFLEEERTVHALCRQRGEDLTDLLRRYGVDFSSAEKSISPGRR